MSHEEEKQRWEQSHMIKEEEHDSSVFPGCGELGSGREKVEKQRKIPDGAGSTR